MADSKISDLTTGTIAAGDDIVYVNSGTTKTDTVQGILDLVSSSNIGNADLTSTANERIFNLNGALFTSLLSVKDSGGNVEFQVSGNSRIGIGGVADNTRVCRIYGTAQADSALYVGVGNGFLDPSTANTIRFGGTSSQKFTYTNNSATPRITIDCGAGTNMLLADSFDMAFGTSTGSMMGTATTQKLGFWNATPIVQPTALTTQLTDITGDITPAVPDYVVAATSGGWGFGSQDEFETAMNVINNLQTRVQELEDALSAAAGGSGLIA